MVPKNIFRLCLAILFVVPIVTQAAVFTPYEQNPILSYTGANTFDQHQVRTPKVLYVNGEYKMYYSGVATGNLMEIGLAVSGDGKNWQRYTTDPIFSCGDNLLESCAQYVSWSSYRTSLTNVIYDEGMYKMWYLGNSYNFRPPSFIGYATSSDGINWSALPTNPISPQNAISGFNVYGVEKIAGLYHMYFTMNGGAATYHLTSVNGISWPLASEAIEISSTSIHPIGVIDSILYATIDGKLNKSENGTDFAVITDEALLSDTHRNFAGKFMKVGSELLIYTEESVGRVTWGADNTVITRWTAPATLLGDEDSNPEPPVEAVPLITQIVSPYPSVEETSTWADDVYAGGAAADSCGTTIAQCGCALASMSMLARSYGIEEGEDGKEVSPGNMNEWLEDNDGYAYGGSVLWGKVLEYLSSNGESYLEITAHNETSESSIRSFVENTGPAVGYSNTYGHYFVIAGTEDGGGYTVRDPWWYNTETTNDIKNPLNFVQDYNDTVSKANFFTYRDEPQQLARMIEVHLASPAELLLRDPDGNEVGYIDEIDEVVLGIDRGTYNQSNVINTTGENPSPHVDKELMLLTPSYDSYILEVVGTGDGPYRLTVLNIGDDGEPRTHRFADDITDGEVHTYRISLNGEVSRVSLLELIEAGLGSLGGQLSKFVANKLRIITELTSKENGIAASSVAAGLIGYVERSGEASTYLLGLLAQLQAMLDSEIE